MEQDMDISTAVASCGEGVLVRVKVVPGASRSKVVGMLGDRLKLAVAAPPEAGKANKAVCKLIAKALDIPARDVAVSVGTTNPQKTLTVTGLSLVQVVERLVLLLAD
jgi:uncharacterized protein (TIGR00251 family)